MPCCQLSIYCFISEKFGLRGEAACRTLTCCAPAWLLFLGKKFEPHVEIAFCKISYRCFWSFFKSPHTGERARPLLETFCRDFIRMIEFILNAKLSFFEGGVNR